MADNIAVTPGAGATVAADDVGGALVQRIKLQIGGDGVAVDAAITAPLPVRLSDGTSAITTLPVSVATLPALVASSANIGDVDVLTLPALPAGTNNIGDVDVLTLPALPTGSNTIGAVNIAASQTLATVTTVGTVSAVAAVTPGTGATNLGKAEDAVHASGDTGVMALGVRNDSNTALAGTSGDYAPLQVDSLGNLKVAIISGAGSGGTSATDNTAFTRGTTSVTPVGAVVETSAPTLTNGNTGALSLTTGGALRVNITSGGIGAILEDAASAGGEEGIMVLAVRRDSASSGVGADGDFAALSVTSDGSLRVAGSSGTTQYVEDVASAGAESLVLMGAVRRDTAASSSGTDGDYSTINVDSTGRLHTNVGNSVALAASKLEDAASVDGDSGFPALAVRKATPANTSGTDGDYEFLQMSAGRLWTSATIDAALPTGANTIGAVNIAAAQTLATVTTVSTVTAIGTSVTPGTSATHLGKAEDAAHASGDTGVYVLAVRTDTAAASSGTTGDYESLHTDSVGALWSRSTGELADDSAFTPATSRVMPCGYTADETATDSVDEGDIGAARMTLDRKQIQAQYAHTAGGWTPSYAVSAASTNATSLKASAGQVGYVSVTSVNAAMRYLKFYNKASAPTVGTDTPVMVIPVPGNTAGAGAVINFGAGVEFATGIAWALTSGATTADTGAVSASEHVISIGYK